MSMRARMFFVTWSSTSAVLPPASRWTSARTASWSMSVFCMRFAVTSSASSSGMPSCSSVTTRLYSRLEGSGASSATTPIAPARLCPARSAEASTSRFSGSCSPNSFRTLRALPRTTRLRTIGGTIARMNQKGPRSTPAITPSSRPTTTEIQISLVGSRSICATSMSSEKPSIQRQLRRRCFC